MKISPPFYILTMGFYRCASRSLTLLVFFGRVYSMSLTGCPIIPTCGQGFGLKDCACVPCPQHQYWQVKGGLPYCVRCTELCSAVRNLKQVIDCGPTQKRVCHCDRGFFCKSKGQFSCRRCEPCPAGTFSSKLSMEEFCQPYTDCSGLGLAVISKGTSTQDQLCTNLTPSIDPHTDPPIGTVATTRLSASQRAVSLPIATQYPRNTSQLPTLSTPSSNHRDSTRFASALVQYSGPFPWLPGLVAALLVSAMFGVCYMWHKSYLLKRRGWPFLKHLQEEGWKEETLHFLSEGLLDSKTGDTQQVAPPKHQVTVDHSGGGDSVSNTVGSIYIYSPRMVVLGNNSSEQREEAEPPGEEEAHLGSPQQESHVGIGGPTHQEQGPIGPPVRVCVQEEESKELGYPVPATSK